MFGTIKKAVAASAAGLLGMTTTAPAAATAPTMAGTNAVESGERTLALRNGVLATLTGDNRANTCIADRTGAPTPNLRRTGVRHTIRTAFTGGAAPTRARTSFTPAGTEVG